MDRLQMMNNIAVKSVIWVPTKFFSIVTRYIYHHIAQPFTRL